MSSVVAEKQFVWRFVDKVTQGVKQARQSMDEAANSVKQSGTGVKNAGTDWKEMGVDAKNAAQEASQSIDEMKEKILSYQHAGTDAMRTIRDQLDLYEKQLNGVPKEKLTNLKAKVDDSALKAHERMIHDVPPEKGTRLYIKDAFSNQLKNFKNKFHDATSSAQRDADNTKRSFSTLKGVMAGTFVGGAVLNGIYAIGNGLKEAAGAGMQFDTEQQKMLATWHTLTGSAGQAKGMVNTINDLSIKTGQATDTINELEQGFYHLHSRKSEADDMTKAMLNMGDAVGLSGQQLTQVEQDMVHGLATGKVTQGELNQIGMYFPMIDERMAKHFHTTVAGMRKMASAGKITGKDLEEVFEQMGNSGKYKHAVDNMMQTTWGSMRTIRSMGPRLVGAMEEGLFQARNPLVGAIAKWTTDPATKKGFQNFGKGVADAFNGLNEIVINLIKPFEGLNRIVGAILKQLASGVWQGMKASFETMAAAVKLVSDMLSGLFGWIGKLLSTIGRITGLSTAFKGAGSAVKGLGAAVGAVLGPIVALRGAIAAYNSVVLTYTAVSKIAAAASKLFAGANGLLDASLLANPITWVVAGVIALAAGFYEAYKHIKPFREGVDRLGASLKRAFTGKAQWEKDLGRQFKNLNKAFDNDAKAFQKKLSKWNTGLWNGMTGNAKWEKDLRKKFDSAKKEYDRYSRQQLKSEQIMQKERQRNWNNFWSGLSKKSRSVWNDVSKHASNGMKDLRSTIAKHSSSVSKTWDNTWSTMKKITVGAWQVICQHSSNGMETVRGAISSGMSRVSSIWNSGWNSMASFFKGIWGGIKQAAADGMNGVINVINAAIGGINKVWSFFTGHGTGLSNIGHVHFAQGGTVRRHLSVINDGDGPDWKELVQTPDGGLYMSQERNWTGFLPEGTRVYSGPETRQIMNAVGVNHYASGGIVGDIGEGIDWAKGSLENIGSWIGDKLDALMDFLDDPLKSVKGLLQKATSGMMDHLGNYAGIAKGSIDKLTQPIADWFKKGLEPILEKMEEANPGGAGVARWRPYILRAARVLHTSLSAGQIQKMLTQINTESGGNPGAIGGTDGLADGHATGLLQFKPRTFASWALPGHGNIMNGFDQILAAIHCLNSGGEGGWGSFGIPGRGWATGGEITSQQFGWIGDNPEHHEFVLNPYAPSAEPLLDKAFEATASAQPSGQSTQGGNSKLDRMIQLLEILVANVEGLDLNISLDGEAIRRYNNKENAKEWNLRKG